MNGRGVRRFLAVFSLLFASFIDVFAQAPAWKPIDIPYTRYVLKNGLTLIVHEDHKAPIVAVNIWYHVGSKNEPTGRMGFAHLFEHLMFNGSEHYNDDYFKVLNRIGATELNGTTSFDRTNYFENVPTTALDTALWMESDRMGFMANAIDKARLDEQRGVVQNEEREGENQPYGKVIGQIFENVFPKGHPYWSTSSTAAYMQDLNAATLDDVREWFKTYYGAANAVMVIAGDVDTKTAKEKVERYFGNIPSGPPVVQQQVWIAKRTETHLQTMQDRVPQTRFYQVWNGPQWGAPENSYLDLTADVLATGKTSRLYKRLVYDDQTATNVEAFSYAQEIAGIFAIIVDVRPGVDPAVVKKAMSEEMQRFLKSGPTAEELIRVKTQREASFIRGVEKIGGFDGKSDVLAMSQVFAGAPDFHKVLQERIHSATAVDLQLAAQKWFSNGDYILQVDPFPEYSATGNDVDRSRLPEPGAPPAAVFDKLQRSTLSNGLKVILAERHAVPQVNFRLIIDAGYAADRSETAGLASMTLDMLDEGTTTLNALQISDKLAMLGAELSTGSGLDTCSISFSALKQNLDPSIGLFADVILHPAFSNTELERLRKQRLAGIEQEKVDPYYIGYRLLPQLLYGKGHAYSLPLTGTGTEESTESLKPSDLVDFHAKWFFPNHSTLIVVGDTTLQEIQPKLEKAFAEWKPGQIPQKNIPTVTLPEKPTVYIVDRPQADQSEIFAAQVVPPKSDSRDVPILLMQTMLGGDFTSRLNMNLRENKHWSYGAGIRVRDARGQRPFIIDAPVQTDKTKESMIEILKELNGIRGEIPITEDELAKAKAVQTLTLAGRWETMELVVYSIAQMVGLGLPENYFDQFAANVNAATLDQVKEAADIVKPSGIVWVVVGDREKIEKGIRELNFGEVQILNADGKTIQ